MLDMYTFLIHINIEVSPCRNSVLVFTARKRSLGQGNIFAPVCHSVHGGSTLAGTSSPSRYTPHWPVHPLGRYTPWQEHPPGKVPPGRYTPRRYTPLGSTPPGRYHPLRQVHSPVHAGIRSTSGRYASYWNAFLFLIVFEASYLLFSVLNPVELV